MKNKKIQSIIALGMTTAMLLSACGTSDSGEVDKTSGSGNVTSANSSVTGSEENATSEEPITLTVWTHQTAERNGDPNNAFTKYVEEKFNVDLVFQFYQDAERDTQLNLMFESGEYPDILIGTDLSPAQVIAGAETGAFLPLNDYITEGTNYRKALDENPSYEASLTASDGNIYTFFINDTAVHMNSQSKMWYRADWMEKLGWETPPSTPEEFKEFLIQIRDTDVNGNGDTTDEIPLMGYYGSWYYDPVAYLMNPFELYTKNYYYITDNNEVYFSAITDGYRKGLAYVADLYAEGLITEETYVQDKDTFKGILNKVGEEAVIGCFPNWWSGNAIDSTLMSWFTYEALAPLKGDYQQTPSRVGNGGLYLNSAITTACEHPDVAYQVMDWLLSEEASWMEFYGVEGETYEWVNAENFLGTTPAVKLLLDGEERKEQGLEGWVFGSFPRNESAEVRYSTLKDEALYETDNTWNLVKSAQAYEPYHVSENIPQIVWADDDTASAYNDYTNLIGGYIRTSDTEFIMGIKDINDDAQWQAYLDELNAMGLEEYIDVIYAYYGLK